MFLSSRIYDPDVHPGSLIRILIFYPCRIPDLGVKKARDLGSEFATLDRKIADPANKATITHINFVCEPD
jgi:hypothetical protein